MSINERFSQIITALFSSNKSAFASAIGVTPSVVDNLVGKRHGKPSFDVVEKVSALAEININWLLTGEGEMLKEMQNNNNNGVLINGSNTNSPINNKHYYSDALQIQNELLQAQIKKKDAQIKSLLAIIEKQTTKGIL